MFSKDDSLDIKKSASFAIYAALKILMIKFLVSAGRYFFSASRSVTRSSVPAFCIAFFNAPSPQLYAIAAKYHLPN